MPDPHATAPDQLPERPPFTPQTLQPGENFRKSRYPAHHHLLGAGKYGLASLANLDQLPPTGAIVIAAPLRIAGGSGSPMRALALIPTPA